MEEQPRSKTFFPYLLFLGAAFIAFSPCLLGGKVYFANDLLASHSHFRSFLRTELFQGHFPLWNPYLCGGVPFFADPDAMMCYPLNYLTLLFPIPYGLGVFYFLHMFLAAAGTYLWMKNLRLSETACRLGAMTYGLSGFFWWELIHPSILAALTWFPWVLACLEKLTRDLSTKWAFLSGLCFAVVFCCGNFQITTCVLYTALPYFLFRVLTREEKTPPSLKKVFLVLLFGAWGSLPLIASLIPAYELSNLSNRHNENHTYDNYNGTFSMVPKTVYEFLFPAIGVPQGNTLENAIQQITDRVNTGNDFLGAFGYVGIWAPFLAVLAFKRKEKKWIFFLAGMGLLAILTAWGRFAPFHQIWCAILPGIKLSRAPFRFVLTYVLSACALAAYGYQTLERRLTEKNKEPILALGAGFYGLLLIAISFAQIETTWRETIALGLGAAGLILWSLSETWKTLGRIFFIGAWILPLFLSGWAGFGTGPSTVYDYDTNFPAFPYLAQKREGGRYYFDQNLLYQLPLESGMTAQYFPPDGPMEKGIRSPMGYVSLYLENFMQIQSLPTETFLRLMAVKGYVFGNDRGEMKEMEHHVYGGAHLYEFSKPVPYLNAPSHLLVAPDPGRDLEILKSPEFDPAAVASLAEPLPTPISSQLTGAQAQLTYEITRDEPNHQAFKVRLDKNSLVVFSEAMYPGWKALVDGKPAGIFTADHLFRSVFVPSGDHRVEFHFEPRWFKPLMAVLFLWFLSAIGYGIHQLKQKRTQTAI